MLKCTAGRGREWPVAMMLHLTRSLMLHSGKVGKLRRQYLYFDITMQNRTLKCTVACRSVNQPYSSHGLVVCFHRARHTEGREGERELRIIFQEWSEREQGMSFQGIEWTVDEGSQG